MLQGDLMKNNKKEPKGFENYPAWMVLVYNLFSFSLYFVGIYLLYLIHPILGVAFFAYAIYLEFSVYKGGCVHCYYYGKVCVSGKGKIAKLFFKKGEHKKFCERTLTFKEFIPQLFASIIPIAAGAYLLIKDFNWFILILTIWPLVIWFLGNPIIYGKLACPNCRQGSICCPACEFFMKKYKK
jgi:hypothetical protein